MTLLSGGGEIIIEMLAEWLGISFMAVGWGLFAIALIMTAVAMIFLSKGDISRNRRATQARERDFARFARHNELAMRCWRD